MVSNTLNDKTGHYRLVVHSTLTGVDMSLVETENGIVTYSKQFKKLSNNELIDKLKTIRSIHMSGHEYDDFDPVAIEIDELIEDIPKMRSEIRESVDGPLSELI
ncbi:MAG: hypothetical protein EHM34_04930, partial [Nitrosopumilales archaeon]